MERGQHSAPSSLTGRVLSAGLAPPASAPSLTPGTHPGLSLLAAVIGLGAGLLSKSPP